MSKITIGWFIPQNRTNQTCDYWLITPNQHNFVLKLRSFYCGQLQISEQTITEQRELQYNTANGAMSVTISRLIYKLVWSLYRVFNIVVWNLSGFTTIIFIWNQSMITFDSDFNDTHRERLMFQTTQYRNGWLTASDLSDMFIQPIKF